MVNLNDRIDPNLGWTLLEARSLNDLGQIVGSGLIGGQEHAFLMTPVYALVVTKVNGSWGRVEMDPEPNDVDEPAFPAGTWVTLTAVPNDGKFFSHWEVYDPNHPDDDNHAVIDANNPLVIRMDADRQIVATFRCGGSGLPALLPAWLAFAIHRRRR